VKIVFRDIFVKANIARATIARAKSTDDGGGDQDAQGGRNSNRATAR
jgi:hypothetical protein